MNKSTLVPYSAEAMYALVNDVASYPEFLPMCSAASVRQRGDGGVEATVEMATGGLRKSFTTLNRPHPHELIELELLNGPFRRLQGCWRFDSLDEAACRISLTLEFEFSNRLLALTVGPLFTQLTSSMVDAFRRRAQTLYG